MKTNDLEPQQEVKDLNISWWQEHIVKDLSSDIICVTAGYGSGKTFAGVLWAYDRILLNEGTDVLFIEPKFEMIRSVAIPAFEDFFTHIGMVANLHYRIYVSPASMKILFPNGAKIHFLSGQEPKKIVGYTKASCAVIDEAGLMEQEVLQKTVARCRNALATRCQVLVLSTTEGLNWLADEFDSDVQSDWRKINEYTHLKEQEVIIKKEKFIVTKKRVRATTFSNKANLSPSYIPNLLATWGHNQNYIDAYVYGFFRPFSSGLAYSNFKPHLHKIKDSKANPFLPIYMGWDFNIEPAWISGQLIKNKEIDKTQLILQHNSDEGKDQLTTSVAEFADKYPVDVFKGTPIHIYGDMTGHANSHKVELSDYKVIKRTLLQLGYLNPVIMAAKVNPRERISVDAVQRAFADNRILIDERCQSILKSISRTSWSAGEQKKLDKPSGDTWTHHMDAVKYTIFGLMEKRADKLLSGRN